MCYILVSLIRSDGTLLKLLNLLKISGILALLRVQVWLRVADIN